MAETGKVARRAGIVALGTLASRVLGVLRESVVAALFPVAATDAFFIAYTIPNTLRMLLGEGAVSNAFVPVFTDVQTKAGTAAARRFLGRFAGALALLLLLACALGMLGARPISWAYALGLVDEPQRFELMVWLTRWLFPFLFLTGLGALAAGALNARGHFAVPALAPALVNVAMIAAPFLFVPLLTQLGLDPIASLAVGALLGGVLQLLVQLPALRASDLLPRPQLKLGDPDVRRAMSLMGPLVVGLGVYQLNMLLSRLFASFLPAGGVSYLNYGQRIIEIPQGMFALAIASAALPTLARLHSEGKRDELLDLFRGSLRLTAFIAVPASLALMALAEPILAVLLGRGAYEHEHVLEAARSLSVQAAGVWSVALVRTTIPMFAAHNDTRTPVKASALNLLVFLALSAALLRSLGHVAIALANSVAAAAQLAVLLLSLRKHTGPLGLRALLWTSLRMGVAALSMALVVWLAAGQLDWTRSHGELARMGWLAALIVLGVGVFLGVAAALRAPELTELAQAVRRRRRRAAL
jgi:putative peptidoglycan lipid II flippase